MPARESAGVLLYRGIMDSLEVLLGHPGGPGYADRDDGAWTIPKGELEDGEDRLAGAIREFTEETGFKPDGHFIDLGSIKRGRKVNHIWALEMDWDPKKLVSNTFTIRWPSGIEKTFPELDRAEWFDIANAERKLHEGQRGFLDVLMRRLKYCALLARADMPSV